MSYARYVLGLSTVFMLLLDLSAHQSAEGQTPYVDRYGQEIAASWPGKVVCDQQLQADSAAEDRVLKQWNRSPSATDAYGGSLHLGRHDSPTGYYYVVKHRGVWWLITPLGNPCFYVGLDTAPAEKWETTPVTGREQLFTELPPKQGQFAEAWGGDAWGSDPGIDTFAFCTSNLIRKYGPGWADSFTGVTKRRLHAWGFSGLGKWGQPLAGVPSIDDLSRTGVAVLVNHPRPVRSGCCGAA